MRFWAALVITLSISFSHSAWAGPHKRVDPKPAPPELLAVEDAMAGPHLVGLFYLDWDYIMRLEEVFGEEKDAKALPTVFEDEDVLDDTAFGFLRQAGLKPGEHVEYMVGAFSGNETKTGELEVLIGHFPTGSLAQKWNAMPAVKPTEVNGRPAWLWTPVDQETCRESKPQMLVVDERYLIIGDPETVAWFLKRLSKAEPKKDLSAWRAYRTGKPFAFSVMLPRELQKVSENMMAQMFAQNAQQQMPALSGIYGGGTVNWEPEEVVLEILLETNDAGWNQETLKKYEMWRQQTEQTIPPEYKSIKGLFNYVSLTATERNLVLQFKINDALVNDFEKIAGEGMEMFTSSLSPKMAMNDPEAGEEQILPASEVNQYARPFKTSDLDPFDAYASPMESYSAQSGPFGIKLKGITLNPKHKHIADLHVEVVSSPFPEMELKPLSKVGEGAGAWFRVTHVYDRQGRELLLDEPCGRDRNETYAPLQKGFRNVEVKRIKRTPSIQKLLKDKSRWSHLTLDVLRGTKVAHLRKGILLSDIDRVEGEVVMQLPADIVKRRVNAPFKGKEVETEGLRIKMHESQGGAVAFIASGDVPRLLETRALNASGKYLRSSSNMASPILFGQGVTHNRQFQGTPRSVEFVMAQGEEKQTYPFSFQFQRPSQPLGYSLKPVRVTTESERGFMQKRIAHSPQKICRQGNLYHKSGAFHFCLNQRMEIHSDWQSMDLFAEGDLAVHGPDHDAINHNLSAVELAIDKVILQDTKPGKRTVLPVQSRQFLLMDNSYLPPLQGAKVHMKAGPLEEGSEELSPVGFEGTLQVRLPRQMESIRLDLNDLGNTAQAANGLKVRFLGIVENVVQVEISGPRETLVQFKPQDASRKDLAQGPVALQPSNSENPNVWQAEIQVSPETRYMAVVYATQQDTVEIPFHLEK